MWILTFHSMCARLLRREHMFLGVPSGFTIYDDGDTERLIAGILKDLDLDPKRFTPRAMSNGISHAKDQVLGPDEFASMASNFYEETIAKVFAAYETRKRAAGALDFDDLITETVRLFRDHPEVLASLPGAIPLPHGGRVPGHEPRAVRTGAANSPRKYRNVCVVGDADQAMYSWRGATIQNILDFERDYPDAQVFLMEQNYRSSSNILGDRQRADRAQPTTQAEGAVDRGRATANSPFATGPRKSTTKRSSWSMRSSGSGESEGFRYSDVAVFYRTNAQSRVLEDVLMRVGTPYRVFGGVRFYQRRRSRTCSATCGCC